MPDVAEESIAFFAFKSRAHREKRFDNRRQNKLPPSIRANKQLELRIVKELLTIFPISNIQYEVIKARTENGKGRGFSPAMVGQKVMLEWLQKLRPTEVQEGWQTSILRQQLGLSKDKSDKSAQKPSTHANDGITLAASHFMSFERFHTASTKGHRWNGQVQVTSAPFRIIARPNLYRRQLHFENPVSDAPNNRKRKGRTVTPFGLRSGDLVKGEKAGTVYQGWIGGYTQTEKTKNVSIYDHNWRRIGQFSPSTRRTIAAQYKALCCLRSLVGELGRNYVRRALPPHAAGAEHGNSRGSVEYQLDDGKRITLAGLFSSDPDF